MKSVVLAFFLIVLTFSATKAQHQIILTTGEKMEGEVKSLTNGQVMLVFKGNNLTFKVSDIASIIFNNSPANTNTSNEGELKGVITYFFNNNYGDKPR